MPNEDCGNLPKWPGARHCYGRAQRLLQYMAERAGNPAKIGTPIPRSGPRRRRSKPTSWCVCTLDMRELIDALGAGNEGTIKGLLLHHDAVSTVG